MSHKHGIRLSVRKTDVISVEELEAAIKEAKDIAKKGGWKDLTLYFSKYHSPCGTITESSIGIHGYK